jgi:hypothetical protein
MGVHARGGIERTLGERVKKAGPDCRGLAAGNPPRAGSTGSGLAWKVAYRSTAAVANPIES